MRALEGHQELREARRAAGADDICTPDEDWTEWKFRLISNAQLAHTTQHGGSGQLEMKMQISRLSAPKSGSTSV